jgi:16S rRNA (cytosine967-C5)-methyltransferase
MRTFGEGGFSNLLLDRSLAESGLSVQDKRLCTQLYYGVTERLLTLEHIVRCYSKKAPEKLDDAVRYILYLGLYQLRYCDGIPDRAAVNESVALTGQFHKRSAAGFVNAVLRSFLRDGKQIRLPEDKWLAMQVQYSAPRQLLRQVVAEHGESFAEAFFENSLLPPPVTVRLNKLRASEEDLKKAGLAPVVCRPVPDAYTVTCPDIRTCSVFTEGLAHVQDLASQLCCHILDPQPGETVLDLCAAPGGKSFTMAERMEDRGQLYAFDLHPQRVQLIVQGAERLGLHCIHAAQQDAMKKRPDMPEADRILCDVPCSGLGVIRRKPEIKYKPLKTFAELPEIQYTILENASGYLKTGGTLVYSTCTISRAENEEVVQRFLTSHPEFEMLPLTEFGFADGWATFSPAYENCDGFFAARMRKVR